MDDNGNGRNTGTGMRAGNVFALRLAVSAYLVYLGYSLLRARLTGESTLPAALDWICGPGFIAAGVLFGLHSWKRYRRANAPAPEQDGDPPGEDGPDDAGA